MVSENPATDATDDINTPTSDNGRSLAVAVPVAEGTTADCTTATNTATNQLLMQQVSQSLVASVAPVSQEKSDCVLAKIRSDNSSVGLGKAARNITSESGSGHLKPGDTVNKRYKRGWVGILRSIEGQHGEVTWYPNRHPSWELLSDLQRAS